MIISNIYGLIFTIFYSVVYLEGVSAGFVTDFVATDCIGGENCASGGGNTKPNVCPDKCTRCNSLTECTQCEWGYFTYHTPNSTIDCVKCPFVDDWTNLGSADKTIKCPECIENADSWQFTRLCRTSVKFTKRKVTNPVKKYDSYRIYDNGNNYYSFYLKWVVN